jgi:phosphate transport system substrate-binding protein
MATSWINGLAVGVAVAVTAGVAVMSGSVLLNPPDPVPSPPIVKSIRGSGSVAQEGAMDAWRAEFHQIYPQWRVNYEANGSGAGIRDFIAGRSAFAGSDVPLSPSEQALADRRCGGRSVHLPMVVRPITLAYNVPSVPNLKLSPTTLAGIFSGRITRWDHPEIAADNRGSRLPRTGIHPFHRADDTGTNYHFTSFLKAAGHWPHHPSSRWTGSGHGVTGAREITEAVRDTEHSIGYVEHRFAGNAGLSTVKVRNARGQFVSLSPESASKALEGARIVGRGDDLVVAFDHRTKAHGSYPIVTITYEITCSKPDPLVRAFLNYTASAAGQSYLALHGYAPLPHDLLAKVRTRLGSTS